MELRHLRYFVAVAEAGVVGRAAERLRIAQPALSRQIRQLEVEVGTALFERSARGVQLTAAGEVFLVDAREALAASVRAVEHARSVGRGDAGTLRVGFVEASTFSGLLPRAFREQQRRRPGVTLQLVSGTATPLVRAVQQRRLDVVFAYETRGWLPEDLVAETVMREAVGVAIPRGHALAKRKTIALADLADEPFVWIPRASSPAVHDRVTRACVDAGFTLRVVQEYRGHAAGLSLVAAGAGLTFVVRSAARYKPTEVVIRPVRGLDGRITLSAVTRTNASDEDPRVAAFLADVRTLARAHRTE